MIMKEIQKRPFVRPLGVWITGIVLQTYFDCTFLSLFLLCSSGLLLLASFRASRIRDVACAYDSRWVWGAVFLSLLLTLSIQRTAFCRIGPDKPDISLPADLAGKGRAYLLKSFEKLNLPEDEKSVLATITLGYRKHMKREVRNRFSTTGVAHLLAVSGFHVAVVCGFLSFLFSFLPNRRGLNWLKYILTLCLLWSFVLITGLAVSAVRAGLMLTLFLTGKMLRRMTDGYNTLAASAFCMLAYQPFYLYDIGFQLSYLAVFFILYLQPRLQSLIMVRNLVIAVPWGWVTVTVAAQAGTALLCLYYFRQLSLVFLFTNLPLTFLSTFLIPAGLAWMILPAGVPGYGLLQLFVEKSTHALFAIVDAFSRVAGAGLYARTNLIPTLLGYAVVLSLLVFAKTRRPRMLLLGLLLLWIIMLDLVIERFFTG